jgi:hypothetical protein
MAYVNENGKIIFEYITKDEVVQANYLASFKDDSKVDDAIILWTGWMPWNWGTIDASHTEIGFWLDGELWFCSATSRPELGTAKQDGTRWIKASELLRHPERWELQVKDTYKYSGSNCISIMVGRANDLMGKRYDFYGVVADFTNPVRVLIKRRLYSVIGKMKKIYCSKFVHAVQTGWVVVFSPKRRWKWAKKNGYKSVSHNLMWLRENGVIE